MSGSDFTREAAKKAIKNALAGYQNTVNNQQPPGPQLGQLSVDLTKATMPDGTIMPVQVIGNPAGSLGGTDGNIGGYAMVFPDGSGGGLAYWPSPHFISVDGGGQKGYLILNNVDFTTVNSASTRWQFSIKPLNNNYLYGVDLNLLGDSPYGQLYTDIIGQQPIDPGPPYALSAAPYDTPDGLGPGIVPAGVPILASAFGTGCKFSMDGKHLFAYIAIYDPSTYLIWTGKGQWSVANLNNSVVYAWAILENFSLGSTVATTLNGVKLYSLNYSKVITGNQLLDFNFLNGVYPFPNIPLPAYAPNADGGNCTSLPVPIPPYQLLTYEISTIIPVVYSLGTDAEIDLIIQAGAFKESPGNAGSGAGFVSSRLPAVLSGFSQPTCQHIQTNNTAISQYIFTTENLNSSNPTTTLRQATEVDSIGTIGTIVLTYPAVGFQPGDYETFYTYIAPNTVIQIGDQPLFGQVFPTETSNYSFSGNLSNAFFGTFDGFSTGSPPGNSYAGVGLNLLEYPLLSQGIVNNQKYVTQNADGTFTQTSISIAQSTYSNSQLPNETFASYAFIYSPYCTTLNTITIPQETITIDNPNLSSPATQKQFTNFISLATDKILFANISDLLYQYIFRKSISSTQFIGLRMQSNVPLASDQTTSNGVIIIDKMSYTGNVESQMQFIQDRSLLSISASTIISPVFTKANGLALTISNTVSAPDIFYDGFFNIYDSEQNLQWIGSIADFTLK